MKRTGKPRVVIDTNLLISAAIAPKGFPNRLIQTWQKDQLTLIISSKLLLELEEVFQRDKFRQYHLFREQMVELVDIIKASVEVISSMSEEELPIHSRDPKDDKLLSCALSSEADYLITGDEDLLVLNGNPALGKLTVISVKNFLNLIK